MLSHVSHMTFRRLAANRWIKPLAPNELSALASMLGLRHQNWLVASGTCCDETQSNGERSWQFSSSSSCRPL